jgi:hypothetical protein
MVRPLAVARSAVWVTAVIAISLLAVSVFLNDLYPRVWRDLGAAGVIVVGATGALFTFRRDSLGRALMWFVSLTIVTLLRIYDVLDALADPFIDADWPIAVIAILLVIGLGTILGILISDDE